MNAFTREDKLEWVGILGGLFVLIVGFGSLLQPPFVTTTDTVAAVVQTIGILATIVVGALLVLISYTGSTQSLLPFGGSSETTTEYETEDTESDDDDGA